jgi:O-antigen/teichoic acid export membrane protein
MAFIFLPAPPNQTLNILLPFIFGPLASVIFLYLNTSQLTRPRILRKFTLGLYAKESKWFAINSISSSLRGIDIVLLGSFSNSFQTAVYSSVSKMIVPLNTAATALSSVTTPHFSKLGLNRKAIKAVRAPIFLLIFICVLALTSILFSEELVVFLLGDRYADASPVLSVLLLAGVASAAGIVLTSTLEAVGKARSSSKVSLISLGVQVTLCVILLPMFGALGAAYALATSTAFAVLLLLFLAVKAFKEQKRFN